MSLEVAVRAARELRDVLPITHPATSGLLKCVEYFFFIGHVFLKMFKYINSDLKHINKYEDASSIS